VTELPLDPVAIDVGHLLQRTVASLYSHLVTRQTGRAVRLAIETQLSEVGERSLSLIDLSEVTVLDFSCADEVVAKLLQHFAGADHTEAFFVFRGVREPHRHQIETVLMRQSLAAVVEAAPGRFELLGARSSAEEEAWGALEARGMVARDEVGELSGGESAKETLDQLAVRRLAYCSPITGRYHALSHLVGKLM
jgi:hypothetical protein